MTTMVKSRATRVKGDILGRKSLSYQLFPRAWIRLNLVTIPAKKGIPRYMNTLSAIWDMVTSTAVPAAIPKAAGRTVMKMYA